MDAVKQKKSGARPIDDSDTCEGKSREFPLEEGHVLLNRYMLMRLIGQGGTCAVYRARDMLAVLGGDVSESYIAVKLAKQTSTSSDNAHHELMLHEALTTRHLNHPNIVKVYDFHRDGDWNFVTMELVEGQTLSEFLERAPGKKLSINQTLNIISSVAEALTVAHRKNIIHSDIKPGNILLPDSGGVKVIDFAIARSSASIDLDDENVSSADLLGFRGYTLSYASPQVIADKPAQPNDDVFSLACVTYEMLSGRHPFERRPTTRLPKGFKIQKPNELSTVQWRVLRRALALDSRARYQSIEEFIAQFSKASKIVSFIVKRLATAACALALCTAASVFVINTWQKLSAAEQLVEQDAVRQAWVEQVKKNGLTGELVDQFNALPKPVKLTVLSDIRELMLGDLESHVDKALTGVSADEQFAHIPALQSKVEKLLILYPDSHIVIRQQQRLASEGGQLLSLVDLNFQEYLQNPSFNASELSTVNRMVEKLVRISGESAATLPADFLARYAKEVESAVTSVNPIRIVQLKEYQRDFLLPKQLDFAWSNTDDNTVKAAQQLVDFQIGVDGSSEYPMLAAKVFVEPEVSYINEKLVTLWFDKDFRDCYERIERLKMTLGVRSNSPLIAPTVEEFVKKINGKVRYYVNKGNERAELQLRDIVADLEGLGFAT
ncbi:serine/threonine-protein kinase [Aurantivibrio plasticivorans]